MVFALYMYYTVDKAVFSLTDPCKVLAAFKAKTLAYNTKMVPGIVYL